ncbi:MAG: glycosyltransferase [Acidobacteriota bacterium]|nr:glycosyltransferase [Acidobacteriota bacterium]
MSNLPLVSVVIPCLNRAHFLIPTIESVLQQDYPHVECIVVDAGSTDETVDILKGYGDRIKWVSEPDNGHADAINKGWRMAGGEILAWLNADDVWVAPEAVSTAVQYLNAHQEVDVVYGDCGEIDVHGTVVGMSYLQEWDLEYAVEHCDHCIPQPAAFLRRRIVEKVGYLDTDFNLSKKDHELWLRIGLAGTIHYIPVLLAHARSCPGYMSQRGDITASACLDLTRKFFALPGVPEKIRKKERRAISNAYLKGLDYAFADGRHWFLAASYGIRAVRTDRSNAARVWARSKYYARQGVEENQKSLGWNLLRLGYRAVRGSWYTVSRAKDSLLGPRRLPPRIPNLLGDRDIEWSWIAAQMPCAPGEALDFGTEDSYLSLIAAQRGFNVTAVDRRPMHWPYVHSGIRFVQGDLLDLSLPKEHYDLVINCSTTEHVGLVGRYDVTEGRPDGDLEAMSLMRDLMKSEGTMLLTIPVGQDAIFAPLCRVYGKERLPRLLDGYIVQKEVFWVKDQENRWVQDNKEAALRFEASAGSWDPLRNVTALGCFVLQKG